jgi:hypothetical protein
VSTKPRFPDPLNSAERFNQLPLTAQFFSAIPETTSLNNIGQAQMLVNTLGAIHAQSNPLSGWQSTKGVFSWLGNRKGLLTPVLNNHIFQSITAACTPSVATTVKEHVVQRSKKVKTGIRSKKGKKSFFAYGQTELQSFAGLTSNIGPLVIQDLIELNPNSASMTSASLASHVEGYNIHHNNAYQLETHAKGFLGTIVNPVDE